MLPAAQQSLDEVMIREVRIDLALRPGFYENPAAHVLTNLIGLFMLASGLVTLWRGVRLLNASGGNQPVA